MSTMGRRKDGREKGRKLGNIYTFELVCLLIPNKLMSKDASLEIYAQELVYLSNPNKTMGDQSYTCSLDVCLDNILLFFFGHNIITLKLFDIFFCRWVFDPEGKPSTL